MTLTVSELNEQAKILLESTFGFVQVVGEVSRFIKNSSSGHWYFTLKDEKSSIACAMFKFVNSKIRFDIKDGMKVVLSGKVSLYTPSGNYQFIVSNLQIQGEGELDIAFKQLKERLEKEGLFDITHKKSLPSFPKKVAIITSITSAAYQDMLKTANDRFALCKFYVYNSLMQGDMAVNSIIKALKKADSCGYDAIVIARGGGSKEDLWCFNDEMLAREIYAAKTPIISAIGHEIDFSISDFVSDKRSLTPTAAMIDLLPDGLMLMQSLDGMDSAFFNFMVSKIQKCENILNLVNLNLKSKAVSEKINLGLSGLENFLTKFTFFLNSKFISCEHELDIKQLILQKKDQFLSATKDLVQIQKDGKNVNLESLKSGDEISLYSQVAKKTAIIQ